MALLFVIEAVRRLLLLHVRVSWNNTDGCTGAPRTNPAGRARGRFWFGWDALPLRVWAAVNRLAFKVFLTIDIVLLRIARGLQASSSSIQTTGIDARDI